MRKFRPVTDEMFVAGLYMVGVTPDKFDQIMEAYPHFKDANQRMVDKLDKLIIPKGEE